MDSFEWNKITAAALVALLIFMGVSILSDEIFEGEDVVLFGDGGEATDNAGEDIVVALGPSFDELLIQAAANPSSRSFRKCQSCHTTNEGGANRIGPNLFGIVGAVPGSKDFSYSGAMAGKGGTWSYDALNAFLEKPSTAVPGTKMTFAGIRTEEERVAIIAYLRSQSSDPLPLPEVPPPAENAG